MANSLFLPIRNVLGCYFYTYCHALLHLYGVVLQGYFEVGGVAEQLNGLVY